MGLNVMRWPMRPAGSKKYQVNIMLHSLEGLSVEEAGDGIKLFVNVRWKGPWGSLGSRFGIKKPHSRSVLVGSNGVVEWDQTFENICAFNLTKEGAFQPWPITVTVYKPVAGALRAKPRVVGSVPVDLGACAGNARADDNVQRFPISCNFGGSDIEATMLMSIAFVEIRNAFEGFESVQRLMAPAIACMSEPVWDSDDEKSSVTALRKKNSSLRLDVEARRKVSLEIDGTASPARSEAKSPSSEGSQGSENPFDSDSLDEIDVEDYIDEGEDGMIDKSISYGTLAGANLVASEVIPFHREEETVVAEDTEVMTVHSRATSAPFPKPATEEPTPTEREISHPSPLSMRNMLIWKRRRIGFRSPRQKGEPLLNKAYGEEGGDEIDWDRRQSDAVSSDEKRLLLRYHSGESLSATSSNATEALDFGDELFTVGSWEMKDLLSRDGKIKLSANVFFSSFDQRSESAAGESACSTLAAVIADWLNTHPGLMPSKAEFDMLIRDGSAEWRRLCDEETYKDRFPDRHFDLETVLAAGVRPLEEDKDGGFIGFFQPERVEGTGEFDFLKGLMTFDSIWDIIERGKPAVYIVGWNDHFFVLRLEEHCCYIIDTLGERLHEGCNQAYILHFDETTTLSNVPVKAKDSKDTKDSKDSKDTKDSKDSKDTKDSQDSKDTKDSMDLKDSKDAKDSKDSKDSKVPAPAASASSESATSSEKSEKCGPVEIEVVAGETVSEANGLEGSEGEIVYRGKAACRLFVKGFFAGIQLREVELEPKRCAGVRSCQMSVYKKLQIEFHKVKASESFPSSTSLALSP